MLRYILLFFACFAALAQPPRAASSERPGREVVAATASLPRVTPEQEGIASSAIEAFVRDAQATVHDIHSFMVLRHGRVVAEGWWNPYAAENPHMLYSLSKSFTSTAVGLAISEGRFTLDDPVISFFPEDAPAQPGDNLKAMRVRDLLAMASGHAQDTVLALRAATDGNWVRAFLSLPVEFKPGTHFVYNSGATYMLSAIVQKRTGQTVLEYLKPRLFAPLGIPAPTWETCPRGINTGGWGLKLRTEDIAKFGLLYLNKGLWNGRRIIPASWVEDATSVHSDNSARKDPDWRQGYCFQFWRCTHGAFRGDGAFGQYCVVMPEQDAVVVMTSGCGNLQGELALVWKHLLPAMKPAALPADKAAQSSLKKLLAGLTLEPVKGWPSRAWATAKKVSGKTFRFDARAKAEYLFMGTTHTLSSIRVDFGDAVSTLTLADDRGVHRIGCGDSRWFTNPRTGRPGDDEAFEAVTASGSWTDANAWTARLCLRETPFCLRLRCSFGPDKVALDFQQEPSSRKYQFVSSSVE